MARYPGARRGRSTPRLTEARIRAWAEAHRLRTGRLPNHSSGPIAEANGLTWHGVNHALNKGLHGLPGGSSLAQLVGPAIDPHRQYIGHPSRPPLTIDQVLAWADAHHQRTGAWPTADSGILVDAPDETWRNLSAQLPFNFIKISRFIYAVVAG